MPLVSQDGGWFVPIGPSWNADDGGAPALSNSTLDAANEACIFIGHCYTSDLASHTIDTTGSSAIGWRTTSVTFASGSTEVKVGVAAVDTATGPPARAANSSDVITFDVAAVLTGGGGGITANAWQTHVPTTGTKTIAHGDLIAIAVQMTARGGTDTVAVSRLTIGSFHRSTNTVFLGGAYAGQDSSPNMIIRFADGAFGWLQGAILTSTASLTRTWNSASGSVEYGQLYALPFPTKIFGLYGWVDPDADFDLVLYSNPLGTPVAERTVSLDANVTRISTGRAWTVAFSSPYDTAADQEIAAIYKPGASSISTYFNTLAHADHRITCAGGTSSYGVARASGGGAFAAENSNLDQYWIGLIVGGFHDGAGGAGGGIMRHPGMAGGCSA